MAKAGGAPTVRLPFFYVEDEPVTGTLRAGSGRRYGKEGSHQHR